MIGSMYNEMVQPRHSRFGAWADISKKIAYYLKNEKTPLETTDGVSIPKYDILVPYKMIGLSEEQGIYAHLRFKGYLARSSLRSHPFVSFLLTRL
jgi:hypothetical protein